MGALERIAGFLGDGKRERVRKSEIAEVPDDVTIIAVPRKDLKQVVTSIAMGCAYIESVIENHGHDFDEREIAGLRSTTSLGKTAIMVIKSAAKFTSDELEEELMKHIDESSQSDLSEVEETGDTQEAERMFG